jgi:drug/metabolite transporter (DMT)-like permease
MTRAKAVPFAVLLGLGILWGLTFPLNKIAVSEGYRHFGIIFWNQAIAFVVLFVVTLVRGKWPVMRAPHVRLYFAVTLVGTILPSIASYQAAVYLPAGLVALLISLVPMFAFPMALAFGGERFEGKRVLGLMLGVAAVVMIAGPQASLPDRAMVAFIPIALIAPFFYGLEGNLVSRMAQPDADPIQILLASTALGMALSIGPAVLGGHWISPLAPYTLPDLAILIASLLNVVAYTGYVWLIGRAGAVFAAQVAYLVTAAGVGWSMLLLRESYSGYIWIALVLMFAGLFLVQPRRNAALVPPVTLGNDAS